MARFFSYGGWPPYVPVASRRQRAARKIALLRKSGRSLSPVEIQGRKIVRTFWGEAWCKNLEAYSDYANRLPRGRSYLRNGSVLDLQIAPARVIALVAGSRLYKVDIQIEPLSAKRWRAMTAECAGKIDSVVELLRGSLSRGVMEIVTRKGEGLFPTPKEISLSCSCPDWALMCKHVAATLYGVGARLDDSPELLFALRGVDPADMVVAAAERARSADGTRRTRVLEGADLSSVFGIEIDTDRPSPTARRKATSSEAAAKKASARPKRTKRKYR